MTSLQQLNQDVLTLIFEELRPHYRLLPLSRTCHWLRDASAPVLFKYAGHGLNERILKQREKLFLPRAFWPHVRRMSLWCECRNPKDPLSATDEDPLCPVMNHRVVKEVLRNMPGLVQLSLQTGNFLKHGHGISWRRINFFLSLPTLREFELVDLCICPSLPDRPRVKSLAPISSFQYNLRDYRVPWKLPVEERALGLLLHALHNTLESLLLLAEPTPILTLSRLHWPRLRELRIFGQRWLIPDTPLISLFVNFPHLQTFVLALSDPEDRSEDALVIWPLRFDSSFPWPELQHLTLSQPSTKDAIYSHLPPTLQTLALRPWTHYCVREFVKQREPRQTPPSMFPLRTASTLRQVLRSVRIPALRTLELEYCADADEFMLLEDVASRFPNLDTIELHRYRLEEMMEVPLDELATMLRPLAQLRIAKLNLDYHARDPDMFCSCASTFARVCPSLQEVWVLFNDRKDAFLKWRRYYIGRSGNGDDGQVDISKYGDDYYAHRR